MKKDWVLTQEAFDTLLYWLDPDRDRAARKYEQIRQRLIKILICRGCCEAEELADETINRVSAKVSEISSGYVGDPALYFYGVCQKIHLEYVRKSQAKHPEKAADVTAFAANNGDDVQPEYDCLEKCLRRLPDKNQQLVIRYYEQDKVAKIRNRKNLAAELGIAANALRIRAHRIRLALQICVRDCLEQQPVQ